MSRAIDLELGNCLPFLPKSMIGHMAGYGYGAKWERLRRSRSIDTYGVLDRHAAVARSYSMQMP
jgi:hypothetical protein